MADFNNKLRVDFIANTDKFNRKLGLSEGKLKSFGSTMTKTGRMLSTRLTLPLVALGGLAVKQAAKFERLKVTLDTLTGSAEAGAEAFERLVKFSAKTPLQLEELTKVNNLLMGFGLSTDEAFESLKMLGDISAITGGNLLGISVAFGQAAAEGRVMTRDIRQFINNGVPMLKLLSLELGVAEGNIMNMASEGKLSFGILQKAFKNATSEGGQFNNGLDILSQTLFGLFSTLKDNVNIALAALGDEIAKVLNLKEGIPALSKHIQESVEGFKNLSSETKKFIVNVGGIATILAPVLLVLGALSSSLININKLFAGISKVLKGKGGLVGLILLLVGAIYKLTEAAKSMPTAGMGRFGEMLYGPKAQKDIKDTTGLLNKLQNTINSITSSLTGQGPLLPGQSRTAPALPGINQPLPKGKPTGGEDPAMGGGFLGINPFIMGTGFMTLSGIIDKELPKMSNHINGFTMYMDNLTKKITDFKVSASDDFSQVAEVIDGKINVLTPFLQGFANSLTNAFSGATTSFESFAMSMLVIIGDLLIQMGMAAMAASKLAELFAIPGIGFAAGMAAFILGAMIKGIASSIQQKGFKKMASGGIVSGPTTALIGEYPGARSNPEVVAPLSKLKSMLGGGGAMQGEFVLRGQDLVVALQRAERNRNRFK